MLFVPSPVRSEENTPDSSPPVIALFISRQIRPYVEAAEGIRDRLNQVMDAEVETFMLDRYADKALDDLATRLTKEGDLDLIVTVGPEAASFAWRAFPDPLVKIYSIVLNPQKVVGPGDSPPGISLNIPALNQLDRIQAGLPSVKRIGIFYDPENNSDFFKEAAGAAATLGLELKPLTVSSKRDIPARLEQCWQLVDCIWLIPDKTVISESIALHIIKQAVLKKVPVVGYNNFFYESGAAMAFIFNYESLGRQTADLAVDLLKNQNVGVRVPVFETWVNKAVIKKLGIETSEPESSEVLSGP